MDEYKNWYNQHQRSANNKIYIQHVFNLEIKIQDNVDLKIVKDKHVF